MDNDLGKLLGRLTLGGLLLCHGISKLLNGIAPIEHLLEVHHLPSVLAYGVYLGELVAPVLVILGIFARAGGALIAVNMVIAVYLAKTASLLALNPEGGYALETEVFFLMGGVCVALLGSGRFSVAGENAPLN